MRTSSAGRAPTRAAGAQARHRLVSLRRRARRSEAKAAGREAALATLSHEMREPLNGVAGLAQLLGQTNLDAEQRGYVDAIRESADALVTLVNDLLDIGRIDAGRVELSEVPFSPRHLLASLERMLAPRAAARALGFSVDVRPGVPDLVLGDPGRLRQVLLNLASNGLKFTEAGEVRIEAEAVDQEDGRVQLELRVTDTGIGMDPVWFERLGDAFAQADASIARLYGGSGLGVLISRRLVDVMGGTLRCTSRQGAGTRFSISLPLARAAPAAPGRSVSLAGTSLLVADPQERTRSTVRDLTRLWGMDVRAAKTGREALTLMAEAAGRGRPFDVALVDAALDDPPPRELARRIRADGRIAHARLALLATAGFRGDAAEARAAGFSAYLPRPLDPELMRACLGRLLGAAPTDEFVTVHRLAETRRAARVLVVDDNPVNRRLATILLERAGHVVETADAGAEAVARVEAAPFDVVLMDVQMPGMDGIEATRRIRALGDGGRAAVPIVAVTAGARAGDDARCLAAGMDAHVTKPIDGARLVATVERFAARPLPP